MHCASRIHFKIDVIPKPLINKDAPKGQKIPKNMEITMLHIIQTVLLSVDFKYLFRITVKKLGLNLLPQFELVEIFQAFRRSDHWIVGSE